MKNIYKENGVLSFVLGTGWISRYELSRLAPGFLIRTNRVAGTSSELFFNGQRIAYANALLLDSKHKSFFCARIASLEHSQLPDPEPTRGNDLTELLSFSVELGRTQTTLESLHGLGKMSVIDLGIVAKSPGIVEQEATLYVDGIEAASGIVCIIGECMGLKISETLIAADQNSAFRTSGYFLESDYDSEKVAPYDFRRPDCFTFRQLKAFAAIHNDFIRSLSGYYENLFGEIKLESVDQMTFTEFIELLGPEQSIIVAPALSQRTVPGKSTEEPAKLLLLATDTSEFPVAQTETQIRYWLKKPSGGAVLGSGQIISDNRDILFMTLRDSWRNLGSICPVPFDEIKLSKENRTNAFTEYVDEFEMVATVFFSGTKGDIALAYPLRTLEPVLKGLDA